MPITKRRMIPFVLQIPEFFILCPDYKIQTINGNFLISQIIHFWYSCIFIYCNYRVTT